MKHNVLLALKDPTKKLRIRLVVASTLVVVLTIGAVLAFAAGGNSNKLLNASDAVVSGNATKTNGGVKFDTTSIVTTVPATQATTTKPSGGTTTPTGKFYVVGKDIIDPDGNIFVPNGANVGVRQAPNLEKSFVFNYFGTANGQSSNVQAWGWNTIRVNANCESGLSNPTYAQTYAGLDELIKEYTAKKIVVMIDCHKGGVTVVDVDYNNANVQTVVNFFDTLTKTYKDNPYVWYNTANEPSGSNNAAQWTALQNGLYQSVRKNAPDSIFIADLPAGGNAIENLTTGNTFETLSPGKCNLVYAWHSYGYVGDYTGALNPATSDARHKAVFEALARKKVPMVVGEFGDPLAQDGSPLNSGDPSPGAVAGNPDINRNGANAVMKYAPQYGYGLLWWHATGDSNSFIVYSLTKNMQSPWGAVNNQSILSPAGQTFWNITHTNKAPVKFTGRYADSGCASAAGK